MRSFVLNPQKVLIYNKLCHVNSGKTVELGNYLYVRYADDFVVLCNGTKAEALAMKEELRGLLSTMGLTLAEDKTKVTHITEGFLFLGYRIIQSVGTSGKKIVKVHIPEKAIKSF